MHKSLRYLLIFILAISLLSGCSASMPKPEDTVAEAFTALKNMDIEAMSKYFDYADLMNQADANQDALKDAENQKLIVKNLECKPISSSVNNDTAIVTAEITNIDMQEIMKQYFSQMLKFAFEKNTTTKQDYIKKQSEAYFIELLSKPDAKKVTKTVDILLTKNNNDWKLDISSESTQDAILGGLLSVANNMKNSIENN